VAWRPSGRETWTSWSTPPSANAASSLTRDRSTVAVPKCVELFGGVADGELNPSRYCVPAASWCLTTVVTAGATVPLTCRLTG